uniref:GAG-pre-integrase domain-containing protein n=1 Tax=Tanacetum cinerariifolium TaxID=118510 RepID=A0A6L2KSM9_TANCI|nr:hypothetical protein [Tanacetum cinerariifolium]
MRLSIHNLYWFFHKVEFVIDPNLFHWNDEGKVSSISTVLSWIGSISSNSFLPSILLLMVIIVTVVIVAVILIFVFAIVGVVIVVAIIGVVIVVTIIGVVVVVTIIEVVVVFMIIRVVVVVFVGGIPSIIKLLFMIIGSFSCYRSFTWPGVPIGYNGKFWNRYGDNGMSDSIEDLVFLGIKSSGGVTDLTDDEDPTDVDGDTAMDDSIGVLASLGGEISSGERKSQESNSDNTRGITVGEVIGACSGGIGAMECRNARCVVLEGFGYKGGDKEVVQIILWYLDSECSKHMTGNHSQLMNLVSKFLGTVRFRNDQIAKIMRFDDSQLRNNLKGVDLLSRSKDTNLYTISIDDMLNTSLIYLLSKASKTKSWLWYCQLSHLNLGTLNKLAKDGLIRGIPKLKFQKDHMCSACVLGKKKSSHQPKAGDTNQEKLYLLNMYLYGPMNMESINEKKYIMVIVDDYSKFTWAKFLRSKDEALDAIIKCIKNIQYYKVKTDEFGGVLKNKARLVAQRFRQEEEIKFEESFTAATRIEAIHIPMVEKNKLDEDLQGTPVDATLYLGIIGSLMYLTSSKPDLIYAVCLCTWYQTQIMRGVRTLDVVHQEALNSKEQVKNGIVELYFVHTEYQLADIFTKPLPRERFNFLIEKLGMQSISLKTLNIWQRKRTRDGGNSTMTTTAAQQVALDNALVPLEKRVDICKSNMRIDPTKTQKEPMYQVVLDALAPTTCYLAFLITTEVPEIYMQQLFTVNKKDSTSYKFKIDKKSYIIDLEVFREIFQICHRLPNTDFDELPPDDEIVSFIKELGHKGDIRYIIEVMRDSDAYKTYLAYATGATSPKMKRKLKKPAFPLKKRTLVVKEEEEHKPSKKAGDSRDEANKEGDDEDDQESNDERTESDDKQTEADNPKTSDDEEQTQDDEYLRTPDDYVPTNDETNDESKEFNEEEYEELYGDVNISLKDDEPANKGKDDEEMTVAGHVSVNQEDTCNQVKDDAQATQKTKISIPSSSISSDYAAKYLNINNIPPVDMETDHASKQQVPKAPITSSDTTALEEFDQKTTLFESMTKSKSFNKILKQRALCHSLTELILEDEDAMDEGVTKKFKKRKPYDAKSNESSKGTSKSQSKSTGKSAQAEETVFEGGDTQEEHDQGQDKDSDWNARKIVDFRPPQTWISKIAKEEKPPLSFSELISTPIDFSAYVMNNLKINILTQDLLVGPAFNLLKGTCKSHVELEYNFKECYKVVIDRLDWNNPEGKEYTFNLSKTLPLIMERGHQVVHVDYFIYNDLDYLKGGILSGKYITSITKTKAAKYDDIQSIKDMVLSVSKHDVYSSKRIIAVTNVKVMKWYDYRYLEEVELRRKDQKLYKFKEGDFPRLNLHDIEDMMLLLVQKKLFNLERDVIYDSGMKLRMFTRRIVILKRMKDLQLGVESYQKKLNITKPETFKSDISNRTPYTAYNNPQLFIYVDKYKRNMLMRSIKLYKFSNGTLTSVRTVLHDIASNLRMDYLPKRR